MFCLGRSSLVLKIRLIVFANSVPHRVRKIANLSDKVQTRTFVNFFVVHPKKPLEAKPQV